VESESNELPPELAGFIDRLIVPLLVEQLMKEGHLYPQPIPYYDDGQNGLADAA
jgi:hypothetical protein